ncbi:unnamed protein product [Blepharisma stoltei]|uniref:Maturase K n=1 Tax=Blepharisma stoltei TaxID=1481888 RepID=A0AAU9JHE6_9CILI|nr:unnamed protein product [Blepharisma stoltei]
MDQRESIMILCNHAYESWKISMKFHKFYRPLKKNLYSLLLSIACWRFPCYFWCEVPKNSYLSDFIKNLLFKIPPSSHSSIHTDIL